MFRIISPKLLELFHMRTISQPWISAVKWHFQRKLSAAILGGNFSGGFIIIVKCGPYGKHIVAELLPLTPPTPYAVCKRILIATFLKVNDVSNFEQDLETNYDENEKS